MRIEEIDFNERRIRVTGKAGTRMVMFTGTAERALRRYIGDRIGGYVLLTRSRTKNPDPNDLSTGNGIATGRYTTSEGDMCFSKNGFVAARERLNFRQAVNHFTEMAKHDRLIRPVGLRPLSGTTIQKSIQENRSPRRHQNKSIFVPPLVRHSSPGQRGRPSRNSGTAWTHFNPLHANLSACKQEASPARIRRVSSTQIARFERQYGKHKHSLQRCGVFPAWFLTKEIVRKIDELLRITIT